MFFIGFLFYHQHNSCNYKHYSYPTTKRYRFSEYKSSSQHTKYISKGSNRICYRKFEMLQYVSPQDCCRNQTYTACKQPPIGKNIVKPSKRQLKLVNFFYSELKADLTTCKQKTLTYRK